MQKKIKLKNSNKMAQNTRNYNSLNFLRSVERHEVTGRSLRRLLERDKELKKRTYYSALKK